MMRKPTILSTTPGIISTALLVFGSLTAPGLQGQVSTLTFNGPYEPAPVITGARDLASADLDGDGDAEILVLRAADIAVVQNNGLGFTLAQSILISSTVKNIQLGDLDGDGDQDLTVADSAFVTAYINDGGALVLAGTFAAGPVQTHYLADLNGDNYDDLVVVQAGLPDFVWYPGDGAGTFSDPMDSVVRVGLGESLAFTDLDGDGDLDIASAEEGNDFFRYLNPGNGDVSGLGNVADFINVREPRGISIDSNLLGDLCAIEANRIIQFIQAGPDSFQAKRNVGTNFIDPVDIAVGDVDDDGKQDIVATAAGDGVLSYWLASSRGLFSSFEAEVVVDSIENPGRVILTDIDGDGDPDALVIAGLDQRVLLYKADNAVCSPTTVSTNLQTSFTADSLLLSWDPSPNALACRAEGSKLVGSSFKGLDLVFGPGPHNSGVRLSALQPGQSYKWRVRCVCSLFPFEPGTASPTDTFMAPTPRVGLSAEGPARLLTGTNQAILDWGTAPDGPLQWELVDITGRVLASGQSTALHSSLELPAIPAGVYLLHAQDASREQTLRFIR